MAKTLRKLCRVSVQFGGRAEYVVLDENGFATGLQPSKKEIDAWHAENSDIIKQINEREAKDREIVKALVETKKKHEHD